MTTQGNRKWSILAGSTLAFTVCFAIWMMFAVICIPIKKARDLNEMQFGLLPAMPVLTLVSASVSVKDQLQALKDPRVWKYCQY